MNVGLIDVDGKHFPNLALMKISSYHKLKGDNVEWWTGFKCYDRVYMSKVFTFSPDIDTVIRADEIIKGGTGYKDYGSLPEEIEAAFPDYTMYPNCDHALGDVLYNPETKEVFVPNTGANSKIDENALKSGEDDDILKASSEQRANPNHGKDGKFSSGSGKTKYAPSPQRNKSIKIQLPAKRYSKLCGTLGTRYPGVKAGEIRTICDAKRRYTVKADGNGGFETIFIAKIK